MNIQYLSGVSKVIRKCVSVKNMVVLVGMAIIFAYSLCINGVLAEYPASTVTPLTVDLDVNSKKLTNIGDVITKGPWKDVRAYGAVGNGVADDTAAIQAAIDAVPIGGGIVFFPAGTYRITSSLRIIDNAANNQRVGIQLIGVSGGASGASFASVIEWDSVTTDPILKMYSRDNIVKNLTFRVKSGRTSIAAIDIDQEPGQTTTCTNNIFEHLFITKAFGTLTDGVRIGQTGSANVEEMRFIKVYFVNYTNAGINIASTSQQSKHHYLEQVWFEGGSYGIKTNTASFGSYHCGFSSLSVAAIHLGSVTDNIYIENPEAESVARFLETGGGSDASWPVTINGGRLTIGSNLAPDGRYINFTDGGPLILQGITFGDNAYTAAFKIYAHTANPGTTLIAIGNHFPNPTPFDPAVRQRRIALGNRAIKSDGVTFVHLADEITKFADTDGEINIATIKGLSATLTPANNLRGSATFPIAGTMSVTFATQEPDANYFVSISGNANETFWVTGKTTTGFTLNSSKSTSTATVDWHLIR